MVLVDAQCKGEQSYRVTLKMNWEKSNDRNFPRGAGFPYVVAVGHNSKYTLFEKGKPLANPVAKFVKSGDFKDLEDDLNKFKKDNDVSFFDTAKGAGPESTVELTVVLDSETNATDISIMALIGPSPDWFVGLQGSDLCKAASKEFTELPLADLSAYDGGLDNGTEYKNAPVVELRTPENVGDLTATNITGSYGQYRIEKGSAGGSISAWKVLLIIGCLAIIALAAFLCLYRRCCKRRTLDVPVPLQDEAQWSN